MAKIILIGYGKMGKTIETLLLDMPHSIVAIIDNENDWEKYLPQLTDADVAIDFSMPQCAVNNITRCFAHQVPIVCGTTGWQESLPTVTALCSQYSGSLIYGANFSIGANIFFILNETMARLMNRQPQYEVSVEETHHLQKKDAPSGTAIHLADIITQELTRKSNWQLIPNSNTTCPPEAIPILAHRVEDVFGIHEVRYQSDEDTIQLVHTANQRLGFAKGAIKAALWLAENKNKGVLNFSDIIMQLI